MLNHAEYFLTLNKSLHKNINYFLETDERLTIDDAIEVILGQPHPVGAGARRLGRPLGDLRGGQADVGAAAVEGQAVVGRIGLAVRVIDVDHHRDLLLQKEHHREARVRERGSNWEQQQRLMKVRPHWRVETREAIFRETRGGPS